MDSVKQGRLKTLSNVISIFSKIGSVFCFIGIACMIIIGLIIPFILKGVNLKKHEIKIADQIVKYEVVDNNLDIYVNGKKQDVDFKITGLDKAIEDLEDISSGEMIAYGEVFAIGEVLILIAIILLLHRLSKLFKNVRNDDTPFTDNNVVLIHEMANLMVILFILPIILNVILNIIIKSDAKLNVNFVSITLILITYAASIIFEYGTKLQEKSKLKIYE